MLAWVTVAAAVMVGATWLFATALHARSNMRSSLALGPSSFQSARLVGGIPPQGIFVASLSPAETEAVIQTPVATNTFVQVAVAAAATDMDPDITTSSVANAALSVPSSLMPEIAEIGAELNSLPLPRARPKFASLQPPTDMGTKPTEDARSPRTAIYDITAQAVYLPNGERLEAHSGYGNLIDNPRYVHVKMRGATPPNTYKLTMRESLFHGVRAIRMTPIGDSSMFGRDGILAHTYMLGPTGQSNGCVSFKNYPRFLQAFLRGEINQMVVVSRLDRAPTFVARRENGKGDENAL